MAEEGLQGLTVVVKNLRKIFRRREAVVFALAQFYQALALQELQMRQGFGLGAAGEFWVNRTGQAIARAFGGAFNDAQGTTWFIAHGVDYGVYLELANDRKNEALRPVMKDLLPEFLKDLEKVTGGTATITSFTRG